VSVLLEAENIHKKYVVGKTVLHVLKGASIAVNTAETVAIIGASGAGKSTLLYILGSLHKPSDGRVMVAGKNVYSMSETACTKIRASQIGFVFQSYHLLPEMDVLDNVMLPAMARKSVFGSRTAVRNRAVELLKSVGLLDRMNHTPMELSGGEQQRVAIARALINDPQLVLADEPTGNLDNATGAQVMEYLFSLTKERGHTLVLVTHNEKVASSCDRMFRLQDGILVRQ